MIYFKCIFYVPLLFAFLTVEGQEVTYKVDKVEVTITGGSTLHDWTVKADEIIDYREVIALHTNDSGKIENFGFKVGVSTMDGGRGPAMNNKIYKALKSELHPYVTYEQATPASYEYDGDEMDITSSGVITIGGVDQEVLVEVIGKLEGDILSLTGSHPIKLSDFDIEPPSAMFGQIQTKDDIVVHFKFSYKKN